MARLIVCFLFMAAAFSHAVEPTVTVDKSGSISNFVAVSPSTPMVNGQLPLVITESPDGMALSADNEGICYKIRAYIFKRDDDHAPQFVKSTTCGPRQPRAKDAAWPTDRIVPR